MEPVSWLAVVLAVLGAVAEALRRSAANRKKREEKHERDRKNRDDDWTSGDAGGVFNSPDR